MPTMAEDNKLSWESSKALNKDSSQPQSPEQKKNTPARRDSKTMAKSPDMLTEKDLIAFDHVAAGQ